MAKAAIIGGCGGVRIEGEKNIRAVKKNISLPIIGIIKNDLDNYKVRITPLLKDVDKIINSGADIIAYDATNRKRPFPTKEIILKIKKANRLAMADCSNLDDAKNAILEGADNIGTTLAGYIGNQVKDTDKPNIKLVKEFKKLNCFVMAEGRYNSPELAKKASTVLIKCFSPSFNVWRSLKSSCKDTSSGVQKACMCCLYLSQISWCFIGKIDLQPFDIIF